MHAQTNITSISAAQRLDSRGKPTVQVRLTTLDGVFQAIVPSGASKGDYEAIELRDGDRNAFEGNGVLTAVHNVESVLGPAIIEKKYDIANDLEAIDHYMIWMDGTDNKEKLGANAVLGISMACTRAAAAANVCPFLMLV
jgi:enolase